MSKVTVAEKNWLHDFLPSAMWKGFTSNWYGWVIVVVAALAMIATLPGRTHGLGMITERLLADPAFNIDRVTYANMNLWATLIGALYCLPCGYLIDRFGLKITLTVTVACLGATVLAMTKLTGSWPLFIALIQTRGFGQSALSIISITMVGKWFKGRLSMPMAIYTLMMSLGFAFSFQAAKGFASQDWRVMWGEMGWILLLFMTPMALLLARDPSKELIAEQEREAVLDTKSDIGFTLIQAMQTPAFWLFGLAISVIALIGAGNSLFNESVLTQQGFKKEVYYNLATLSGTVGLLFQIPVGWLGKRIPLNLLQAIGTAILAICLFAFPFVRTELAITVYGVWMGISATITTILFFSVWGQAYGRKHLGTIQSVAQMMTVLASGLGPLVFAKIFERYGSYVPAFQVLAGIVAVLAVWSLFVRVPSLEEASELAQPSLELTAAQEPC